MSVTDERIRSLRRAFDERFARPVEDAAEARENLLLIGAGDERFALRLGELAAFEPIRRIVPLAGARAGVLGIAGWRGRLVPVLDLAHALGVTGTLEPRWLAVHGAGHQAIALAFPTFHGQRQVAVSAIRATAAQLLRPHAAHQVLLDHAPVPVLSLPSLALAAGDASLSPSGADAPRPST